MFCRSGSRGLTAKVTLLNGVKRFGEIEVNHINIIAIVDECNHTLLQYKKLGDS